MAALALAGCTAAAAESPPEPPGTTSPVTGEPRGESTTAHPFPLLVSNRFPIVAFDGSENTTVATFELALTNLSDRTLTPTAVTVRTPAGEIVQSLDAASVPAALAVTSRRSGVTELGPGQAGTLFLTVEFPDRAAVPDRLSTTITVTAPGLPDGGLTSAPAEVAVSDLAVPVLGPPLEPGSGYIAADSCCGSERHRRAALPVDNQLWLAQRFAVDWEQVDARGRTTIADTTTDPASYTIYGKRAIAATGGTVVHVVDGQPQQVPGVFPTGISLPDADGNSVIVDIGHGLYMAYAHMQPGSIAVRVGQRVERSDLIGLVGNSGNSLAPHLHFQVMDGPSAILSEGVPYHIDRFVVTGQIPSTQVFDRYETSTEPMPVQPTAVDGEHRDRLPLDRYVVTFG